MKLTYNYTQGSFIVHADNLPHSVLVTPSIVEGTDEEFAFMVGNDLCETFDISHWTGDDLIEFATRSTGDQLGQLEGLSELQYGVFRHLP